MFVVRNVLRKEVRGYYRGLVMREALQFKSGDIPMVVAYFAEPGII